jgi:hypothetical protein
MDEREEKFHRTWIQYLLDTDFREVAALVLDGSLDVIPDDWGNASLVAVNLPPAAYSYVKSNVPIEQAIKETLGEIIKGYLPKDIEIRIDVKLLEVEENWKEIIRSLIANAKDPNQGTITDMILGRENKQPHLYNEMKFASKSEIRIAQEFEKRKILFFPLPLGVRNDTGKRYLDHREPDFLVCNDGVWGILEVSYHPDRFEKDAEKDAWFKKAGILCIQHYSSERCYNKPAEVVNEFLEILAKHKR